MGAPECYQVRIKKHLLLTMLETVAEILKVLHTSVSDTMNLQEPRSKQLGRKKIERTVAWDRGWRAEVFVHVV